jgi:F-type H+-transporting ATPase subunit alpha
VDVGKSVSRVGDKAQLPAYRSIASLKLEYSQFEELESFARFGTRLDENTKNTIDHGRRIRLILKQPELLHLSVAEQIFILLALTKGLFDKIPIDKIQEAESTLLKNILQLPAETLKGLISDKTLSAQDHDTILKIASDLLSPFLEKPEDEKKES